LFDEGQTKLIGKPPATNGLGKCQGWRRTALSPLMPAAKQEQEQADARNG
jgi:hypothetical protein